MPVTDSKSEILITVFFCFEVIYESMINHSLLTYAIIILYLSIYTLLDLIFEFICSKMVFFGVQFYDF